jgi:nicotinamidase-related amidase
MRTHNNTAINNYKKLFDAGRPVNRGAVQGVVGRIIRGRQPSDFETLTDDPKRGLVMLVDSEGLEGLIGCAGNTYAMLKAVGYTDHHIADLEAKGTQFKLVVFPDSPASAAKLATWDNLLDLVQMAYPDAAPKLGQQLQALEAVSRIFEPNLGFIGNIQRRAGYKFADVKDPGDPRFMDYVTYAKSRHTDELVAARAFLYHTLHLRELYSGDGYTYNDSGQRGVPEYFVPNLPLTKLGDHLVIDLAPVRLPAAGRRASRPVSHHELPVPDFFKASNAQSWGYRPNERKLFESAQDWRKKHGLRAAATDKTKIHLLGIDLQGDFCFPEGSLYVGGRSGTGAIDDNVRIAEFIYRNLGHITNITLTMDTHQGYQIFSPSFWKDMAGQNVPPATVISLDDIISGRVSPDPYAAGMLSVPYQWLRAYVEHYARTLQAGGKYQLFVWPEHCLLGGQGHTIAGVIHEARLFHSWARGAQTFTEVKGGNPLTENYSVLSPEVLTRHDGKAIAQKNTKFIETLLDADAVIIVGQAASHCVKSSIDDLLSEIVAKDPALARKVYVVSNAMSSVVLTGAGIDFTPEADAALARFKQHGMHVVTTDMPMETWPGLTL